MKNATIRKTANNIFDTLSASGRHTAQQTPYQSPLLEGQGLDITNLLKGLPGIQPSEKSLTNQLPSLPSSRPY